MGGVEGIEATQKISQTPEHQSKKTAMRQKLSISENLPAGADIVSPLDAKSAESTVQPERATLARDS